MLSIDLHYRGLTQNLRTFFTLFFILETVAVAQAAPPVTDGLHAWYAADTLTGLVDGDQVDNWPTGTGNHDLDLTALGADVPFYSVTGFKNGPSVHFSTNTPMGTVTNVGLTGDPAFTVVFAGTIIELNESIFSHPWAWGDGSGETGYSGGASVFEIQSSDTNARVDYATGYNRDANTPNGSFNGLLGEPVIVTFARQPGPLSLTTTIVINGVEQPINGSLSAPDIIDTPFHVGPSYSQYGAYSPTMKVAEVIIYDRALDMSEILSIESYLTDKYRFTYDAQLAQIIAPSEAVLVESTLTPTVVVRNNGISTETIPVLLTIGTAYSETSSITLEAGASGEATFPPWHADTLGTFDIIAKISFSEDQVPGNDTFQSVVTVHDSNYGLMAYYPFNSNAIDESGNGHDGTVYGATLAQDRHGNPSTAYSFDGINDYIKASANGLPTGERTVSLWFYANTVANGAPLLGYGGNGGPPGTSWLMMINDSTVPAYTIDVHYPNSTRLSYAYFEEPVEKWHHFAATTDPTGTRIFVDGNPVASDVFFVNNTYVNGKDLSIGVIPNGYGIAPYTDPNISYFNGVIDEVRVYDRVLSQVEIESLIDLKITTPSRLSAKLGEFVSYQLLAKGGSHPYLWSVIDGSLPPGMTLNPEGVFSGTPTGTGEFILTIAVTDNKNEVAEKQFALEVLLITPPPDIRIHKSGTVAVPGRIMDYFISVENAGTIVTDDIVIEEHLISSDFKTDIFSFVSATPEPDFLKDGFVIVWLISPLGPGEQQLLTYKVQLNASVPLDTSVVGAVCRDEDGNPDLDCMRERMNKTGGSCELCVSACNAAYCEALEGCVDAADKFGYLLKKIWLTGCGIVFGQCSGCLVGCTDECQNECSKNNSARCQECPNGYACDEQTSCGPVDPNEKLVNAERYIQPDQLLVYPIHFENIGTIEARDIFITDVLDTNLDLSTLELLTPEGASFDPVTRSLRWELLNRDLLPGETGNILLSIKPLPGLPSGTEIRNDATIQFEVFDLFTTNEVVNIIDTTRPVGVVNPLPAETSMLDFQISWSGTDTVGEIDYYTVLVSEDSGDFTPFVERTSETSAIFTGESGKTYGFICITVDTAGNIEIQDDVAETTTHVYVPLDRDNDGIPDIIEDANSNGVVDLGETDPQDPDSDNDGFDDGQEDSNFNGIVDVGESDPTNIDSIVGSTSLVLRTGYNQVSFPAETMSYNDLTTLMEALGGNAIIEKMLVFDQTSQQYLEAGYNDGGEFYGTNLTLSAGQGLPGLIIYAKQDVDFEFTSRYCYPWDLKQGLNLLGTPCLAGGYTSFDLLTSLGTPDEIISFQDFNPENGLFETASYLDGYPVGALFAVKPGDAYLISMKTGKVVDSIVHQVHGLNFSPYMDGQDPNSGSIISEEQIRERLAIIKPYTRWIRSFSSTHGLENTAIIAHVMGLKTAVGAWLDGDETTNETEITNLINIAKQGHADLLIVGSEVLLRGELTENKLLEYINHVHSEVPGIPVTYSDVYGEILSHPSVIDAVDIVFVNYYPYWEGISIDQAVQAIHCWHKDVVAAANGKKVVVSETGWPSDGNQIGDAIPSPENISSFFLNFQSWSQKNNVESFYFEVFDETWKAVPEGQQGAHWGVWDKDGNLKPGMEKVFQGETVEGQWEQSDIIGDPGEPEIYFTHVPSPGSYENLAGSILHVDPEEYAVAVYIKVNGGWWTKPTFTHPLTSLFCNGDWVADVTTGGSDQNATHLAAFLIPEGYNPPEMRGGSTLPVELDENAVASTEIER